MDYLQYFMIIPNEDRTEEIVLNLIINGLPSIHSRLEFLNDVEKVVLNLIINGLPSIHRSSLYYSYST